MLLVFLLLPLPGRFYVVDVYLVLVVIAVLRFPLPLPPPLLPRASPRHVLPLPRLAFIFALLCSRLPSKSRGVQKT